TTGERMMANHGGIDRERYRIPEGLRPLLEAIARESIRLQPSDIIGFAQLFIDELQHHRRSNPSVDILTDPVAYEMFRSDLHRKEEDGVRRTGSRSRENSPLDAAATKIQAVFRGHNVRNHLGKVKGDMTRTQSSEKMTLQNHKKDQKRHSIGGHTIELDNPEDRAATKIQSEIRGFLARKQVEKMKKEEPQAATKIQAHIRGFLTRKHLEEQGLSPTRSRSRSSLQSDNEVEKH
ncbi:hypothetical protein PENTCL1PPCAC_28775, partial [Pristionchus entomophagus]